METFVIPRRAAIAARGRESIFVEIEWFLPWLDALPSRFALAGHDRMYVMRFSLALQAIAGLEHPPDRAQAESEKYAGHRQADPDAHIRDSIKAPAESADQIDHGIGEADPLPERRQHGDGVEAAAEECQRRDDEKRHDLQLLETVGPNPQDESEKAEADRGEHQEEQHPEWMLDVQWYEQSRRGQDDRAEDHRFARGGADITQHDFDIGNRCGQDFIDRAGEAREVDTEGGIRDALG